MRAVFTSFLWVCALTIWNPLAHTQLPGYQLSIQPQVSYSLIQGKLADDGFPFGLADHGLNTGLSAQIWLHEHWAVNLTGTYTALPYRVAAAGTHFLLDPAVEQVTVRAGSTVIWDFSAGILHRLQLASRWSLQTGIGLGWASLHTPELDIHLITAPHTQYAFGRGSASAFLLQCSVAPEFALSPKMDLMLIGGLSAASPSVSIDAPGLTPESQNLSYVRWTLGLGCSYRFLPKRAASGDGLSDYFIR